MLIIYFVLLFLYYTFNCINNINNILNMERKIYYNTRNKENTNSFKLQKNGQGCVKRLWMIKLFFD